MRSFLVLVLFLASTALASGVPAAACLADILGGPEAVQLAAFERSTWERLVDVLAEKGADYEKLRPLEPLVRALPPALSRQVTECIAARYEAAHARKNAAVSGLFAPKRSLDVLIKYLVDAAGLFKQGKANGEPLMVTYQTYLDRVQACIGERPFGGYRAQEVLLAACAIQAEMKNYPTPTTTRGDPSTPAITLYGSFPNGRANLATSDLDLRVQNVSQLTAIYAKAYSQIHRQLSPAHSPLNLRFNSSSENGTAMGNLAQKNPIAIRVTTSEVQLNVFPTGHVGAWIDPASYPLECP